MPIVTNINLPTPAIAAAHARWAKNRAFLNGEEAVKAQRREFLPPANPADTDAEYDAFLQRTRFLPAAAKIAQGLCGLIARKKAQLNTTSARIQLLTQLISPDGQSLDELSEWVVLETLITNFTGLLVDHPDRNGFTGLSAANEIEQGYRPRLAGYCGESILEVTPGLVNNQRQIVRVRLLEDEGNTVRELMLNNGIYQVRVWTKQNGAFVPGAITTPIRGTEPLTEIPFVLVSTSDKLTPTPSLLQHSVDLNLQHYRVQGLLTSVLYFLSAPIGATPKNKISADVVMPGAATVAAAATALLKTAGVPNARISDFSAFQQTWSLYQTEQVTVGDAVRDCLYQAGGYIIPDGAGVWQVGDYFASKAATAISTDGTLPLVLDVKELNAAAPVYKVKIGFDRCWGVHSDSDVSPALAEVSDANEANAEAIEEAAELAAQAAADAAAAKVRLDALVSDGILDRSEKAQIVREFQQEAAQQTGLVNQGSALNVTAEKNALVTAFGNLSGYLNSLSPAYTDGSQDTVIDRNEWNARWGDYYVAKQNLRNWHAMTNWSAWPMEAKQMVWYRAAIRPASDAEIQAGRATGDISSLTSRIQTEETTRANAVQAVANRTAVVEAQVTSDANNLVRNPTFNAPGWQTGVSGIPLYWGGWAQDNGAYIGASDRRSNYGAAAPLQIDRNGNNNGISQNLGTQAAGWYVLEADITAEDGNWLGCGVHINFNNGYSRNFDFGREADTNGGVVAGNIGSVNRKFSTMFYNGNVGTNVSFYLMAGWEGFATGQGFLRTIWHRAVVRAATDAEIKAQKVIDSNLMARVTTTEQTLAQAGNLAASWKISAETPGASAFITAQAKTSNGVAVSNVSIGGTAINLVNTDGSGVKKGLAVENGTVTVYGALRAGAAIMQGSGTGWPVALASKDFNVSNGDYVAFGTTLDSLPNLTFAGNGLVALNSGETYRLYAENLTRDGFTARLEISVPAQPSNYDLTSGQYSGSGLRIIDKYPRPDSTSNTYNVTVTGTITATAYNNGDTYCIWTEAYTYSGKKGYELQSGDMLMVLEDDGSYAPAPIEEIAFNREDCITLRSASGIELTVSKSTPVTLRDGTSIKALAVQGHELPVMDGDDFRWEEIVAVEEAGVRPVARIYVGDRTFAAGNAMGRSIFTHNAPVNKL